MFSFGNSQKKKDTLIGNAKNIEEVVLISTSDISKDRKTPVVTSTVKNDRILERIGNQDFPEILKHTPSVYVNKGSSFGDGKINIRGFSADNIAVMLNGIPVNDMESGAVYFSNFHGLSDVTSTLQVQRGVGSSKLAMSSVGGTMNFITRASDKNRGGMTDVLYASDEYIKTTASYNTGKTNSGWSSAVLVSRTLGNTFAYGTKFEANSYYFALGYRNPLSNHDFQFTITASPEWHMQNSQSTIASYQKYGTKVKPNRRYNPNWGYLNDDEYSQTINYYSEPIASINWDWKIDKDSELSSVVYASWGRGGRTGILGDINGKDIDNLPRSKRGLIRFEDIVKWNKGEYVMDFGEVNTNSMNANRSNGVVRRSYINSHNLYGFLTNFKNKVDDNWELSVGLDGHYYYGYHTGIISDFLGNGSYTETYNRNFPNGYIVRRGLKPQPSVNPFVNAVRDKSQIMGRNYDGEILWGGASGQAEYSDENVSTFVQGSLSGQGFQRYDHWIVDGVTKQQGNIVNKKTGLKYILGFNIKTGTNINLDENNNIFANFGYYSKQPNYYVVYPYPQSDEWAVGNQQIINRQLTNEKIFSSELGYEFKNRVFNTSINLYYTSWRDRFQKFTDLPNIVDPVTGKNYDNPYANVMGINEVHMGIEYDIGFKITNYFKLEAMFSTGTWYYDGNVLASLFDKNGKSITYNGKSDIKLAFDGVKVSGAAQTVASLGFTLKPLKYMSLWSSWNYYDRYYGLVNFNEVSLYGLNKPYADGALRYPSYSIFDLGFSYTFKMDYGQKFIITGNVYNLLDAYYISDASSSISADSIPENLTDGSPNTNKSTYRELGYMYKGIANANQVYFGAGITWSLSVSYKF